MKSWNAILHEFPLITSQLEFPCFEMGNPLSNVYNGKYNLPKLKFLWLIHGSKSLWKECLCGLNEWQVWFYGSLNKHWPWKTIIKSLVIRMLNHLLATLLEQVGRKHNLDHFGKFCSLSNYWICLNPKLKPYRSTFHNWRIFYISKCIALLIYCFLGFLTLLTIVIKCYCLQLSFD